MGIGPPLIPASSNSASFVTKFGTGRQANTAGGGYKAFAAPNYSSLLATNVSLVFVGGQNGGYSGSFDAMGWGFTFATTDSSPFFTVGIGRSGGLLESRVNTSVVSSSDASFSVVGLSLSAAGALKLYVDGLLTANTTGAPNPNWNSTAGTGSQLSFGYYDPSTSRILNMVGVMGLIFNRELSAGDMAALALNPGQILLWPEDDMIAMIVGPVAAATSRVYAINW